MKEITGKLSKGPNGLGLALKLLVAAGGLAWEAANSVSRRSRVEDIDWIDHLLEIGRMSTLKNWEARLRRLRKQRNSREKDYNRGNEGMQSCEEPWHFLSKTVISSLLRICLRRLVFQDVHGMVLQFNSVNCNLMINIDITLLRSRLYFVYCLTSRIGSLGWISKERMSKYLGNSQSLVCMQCQDLLQ